MRIFFALFGFLLSPLFLYSTLSIDQLVECTSEVTVEVLGYEKAGWFSDKSDYYYIMGFFLNSEGYLLTQKSFLEDKGDIKVRWFDNKGYSYEENATIISEHPTEDVAILKIDSPDKKTFQLRL